MTGYKTIALLEDIREECLTEEAKQKTEKNRKYEAEHSFMTEYGPIVGFIGAMALVAVIVGVVIYTV